MSMVTIRIPDQDADGLLGWIRREPARAAVYHRTVRALEAALRPTPLRPKYARGMSAHNAKSLKHSTKREETRAIREAVFKRAAGQCEGPGPQWFGLGTDERCQNAPTDLLHVFGRGRGRMPQSERNCLAACRACHVAETNNRPTGSFWWGYFAWWFAQHGFQAERSNALKRAALEETRRKLPAAPNLASRSGLQPPSPVEK